MVYKGSFYPEIWQSVLRMTEYHLSRNGRKYDFLNIHWREIIGSEILEVYQKDHNGK